MADKRKYVQGFKYRLYGSGIGSSDTSIRLTSMTLPNSGELVTMTMFGEKGYATIEPGNRTREENISFTGITQNIDGSATLTGVTRGLKMADPYDQDLTLRKSHAGGVVIAVTNSAPYYSDFANKYNDETIDGKYTFPSTPGTNRPVISADTNAVLAEELITKGELNRAVTATFLTPTIVNTSSATTGTSQASSLTWAHVSSGDNRLLLVEISTEQTQTITGVTYNGDALTQAASHTRATGNLRTEIWYRIAPDLGTNNIIISASGAAYISATALTLNSAHQTTPIGATADADGSSTTPSVGVTTTQVNSLIVDSLATANDPTTFTAGANQSIQQSIEEDATRQIATSVEGATATGSYTMSYTIDPTGNWAITAVEVLGIAGGGGGGSDNYTVKATTNDTTPNFLDDKISLVSTDGSVTITKTINNPAANEDIEYDLSVLLAGGGGGTKVAIDTNETVCPAGATTNAFTVNIPGGTLGTNDAIRYSVGFSGVSVDNAETITLNIKYGGTTVTSVQLRGNTDQLEPFGGGQLVGYIIADGATNAQKGFASIITTKNDDNGAPSDSRGIHTETGTAVEDSTVDQNLEIDVVSTGGTNTITAEAIIVEKITDGTEVAEKKVGVGESTDVNWFNTQYQFYGPNGVVADYTIWNMNNIGGGGVDSHSFVNLSSQEYILNNSTQYTALLPDFGATGNILRFNTTKMVIFQCHILTAPDSVNENLGGIGFNIFGASDVRSAQGSSADVVIGFVRRDSDGQWFTHVSDGVGVTETSITLNDSTSYVLRVEYDPANATPQVRFYVDGTLVDTITTNIPTGVSNPIGWAAGNGAGVNDTAISSVSCPSFAVEI